jgi:hypothetical protein
MGDPYYEPIPPTLLFSGSWGWVGERILFPCTGEISSLPRRMRSYLKLCITLCIGALVNHIVHIHKHNHQ